MRDSSNGRLVSTSVVAHETLIKLGKRVGVIGRKRPVDPVHLFV
jgi:hypothetical protein